MEGSIVVRWHVGALWRPPTQKHGGAGGLQISVYVPFLFLPCVCTVSTLSIQAPTPTSVVPLSRRTLVRPSLEHLTLTVYE